jgi:S1-C subfamily serine protease
VTNSHVIAGGNKFLVTLHDGSVHEAELVGLDEFKDLAVLKIDAGGASLVPVVPGDSENLLVGQKVIAIGNPFGLDRTLTTGVISALGREIQSVAGTTISDVIQTDASINPGNSGGPLLDSAGRLIGVNTSIFSTSGSSAGIGFAVPVSTVKRVIPQLIEKGRVSRAGLGVQIIEDDLARRWGITGVIIREVSNGSAAERAGLRGCKVERNRVRIGDVIVGIDDESVEKYDDLYTSLDQRNPGDRVKVRYLRGNDEHEVWVDLQEVK